METIPPIIDKSNYMKYLTIFGDFVWLNVSMLLVYYLLQAYGAYDLEEIPLKIYIMTANLCYVPCISIFGVILHNRIVRPERIVARVLYTVCLHVAVFLMALTIMKVSFISRYYLMWFYFVFLTLVIVWRLSLRKWIKVFRMQGRNIHKVLLVGGGEMMVELYYTLSEQSFGYRVVGAFYDEAEEDIPEKITHQGKVKDVIEWLKENPVHEVYCGLPSARQTEILGIMNFCENNCIRFYTVPHIRNYIKRRMTMEIRGDVPVMCLRQEPLQEPLNRMVKRTFDIVFSLLFLCTIFPILYIIVGLIIKISSPGPIFFKQQRSGENGRVFTCYKFRSMKVNSQSDSLQATKDDPRKTKFGNFLRKSNIDELPQFLNVLKGDMSIVGPRPHMLKHTEEYSKLINKYMMRHLVKPGITGWAQVTGFRGETKRLSQMEGRVRQDLWYIENWSILLDIRIIFRTVFNTLHGDKEAY